MANKWQRMSHTIFQKLYYTDQHICDGKDTGCIFTYMSPEVTASPGIWIHQSFQLAHRQADAVCLLCQVPSFPWRGNEKPFVGATVQR